MENEKNTYLKKDHEKSQIEFMAETILNVCIELFQNDITDGQFKRLIKKYSDDMEKINKY